LSLLGQDEAQSGESIHQLPAGNDDPPKKRTSSPINNEINAINLLFTEYSSVVNK
jgi:hypothetical protein